MKATRRDETIGIALETWDGDRGGVMALVRSGYWIPEPNAYALETARKEIRLSGSSRVVHGEARVFFDQSFSSLISHDEPIRVFIMSAPNISDQLYISAKMPMDLKWRNQEA